MIKPIGHKLILKRLESVVKNNSYGHAYLFIGPKGVGKFLAAEYFANLLICKEKNAYGKCKDCQLISLDGHPDLFKIIEEDNIKIEKTRELKEFCSLKSFSGGSKVVLIKEADKLTSEATNSLLKSLEEPEGKVVFVLTASNINNIPKTIISRCQIIVFSLVPKTEIIDWLIEAKGFSKAEAEKIGQLAAGKPKIALNIAENEGLHEKKDVENFFNLFKNRNYLEKFAYLNKILEEERISYILDAYILYLRDLLILKTGCKEKIIHKESQDFLAEKSEISFKKIEKSIEIIKNLKETVSSGINSKLLAENLALFMEEG
ncbi:MAG: DNA polymerase III subunit delta' [Patescibacteria group bacterium]|nr:DNA polymerase III subunit delta' [Patescibacteria group bacterium]MCL5093818.1 DNA polymerase III subunit delta' [Patescibacteria group bacterium]